MLDPVAEQRLVGEAGERVVERLVGELVLEPLALGDVAEAPHPADDVAVDPLRLRVALEDPAVQELEHVVALGVGLGVELLDLGDEPSDRRAARARTPSACVVVARLEDSSGIRHISTNRG